MVVAHHGDDAAEGGGAGGIGVLEHVHGAVGTRPLAVPHAEDAGMFRAGKEVDLLRAPDGGGGEVLVQPGLEADAVLLQRLARLPERLVQPAERRAAIAGDEARRVEPGGGIALALQHRQLHQRLDAGKIAQPRGRGGGGKRRVKHGAAPRR